MELPDRRQLGEKSFDSPAPPKIPAKILNATWVVVPVHNRLDVAIPCLRTFHSRTPLVVGLIIVDDASDAHTAGKLQAAADAMTAQGRRVHIIRHDDNVRYTRAINSGIDEAFAFHAEWVCTLNSDTRVTTGWLERCLAAGKPPEVGMVCPYMSNAALLTFDLMPGVAYTEMAARLAFYGGKIVDAVTPVGACMFVHRALWEEIGPFDVERCPQGYGEECHFWALAVGPASARRAAFPTRNIPDRTWRAVLATDAYVYHQSHASYGRDANELEKTAVETFKREHGNLLEQRRAQAVREDPRGEIEGKIRQVRSKSDRPRLYFYLPSLQLCGGMLAIGHVVNGLVERGIDAALAYSWDKGGLGKTPMVAGALKVGADPGSWARSGGPEKAIVLATAWFTGDWVSRLAATHKGIKPGVFVQDYESLFIKADGRPEYPNGAPASLLRLAKGPYSVVNSNWVADSMERDFDARPREYIPIGVDTRLFYDRGLRSRGEKRIQILAMYRPETPRRGDDLLRELYEALWHKYGERVDLATYGSHVIPGGGSYPCTSLGVLAQPELARHQARTHVLIEPSSMQGWGMPAQEAMASGAAVLSTANGGIFNYGTHERNCLIASRSGMFEQACRLVENRDLREQLGAQAADDMAAYDWDHIGDAWAEMVREWWR